MFDVEKAMEAVVWMEQCIRDSHKPTRSSQDLADKRLEQVEKLEQLAMDMLESKTLYLSIIDEQKGQIKTQKTIIGRQKKQLAEYHDRKHTGRPVGRPRKEKAAATAESLAEERMEAVLHEAEEVLKSVFEDKLNQELKALRERHYFRNDEISRASQKNDE